MVTGRPSPSLTIGESFPDQLQRLGQQLYHHRHPFNLLMHAGRCSPEDLKLWAANRYYYQTRIPIKDALIVEKSEDPEFRRGWDERITDHEGTNASPGGLSLWRRLGEACGCSERELETHSLVSKVVRGACDEYVDFVRRSSLLPAVASSLTEHFAGDLMKQRIEAWKQHYPFVANSALQYFRQRVEQAPRDAEFALEFVTKRAITPDQQRECLDAFQRKCAILWILLDSVYLQGRRRAQPRLSARATLHFTRVTAGLDRDVEAMILLPERALKLNEPAAAFIQRCDGKRTLSELAGELAVAHGVDTETVELDLATFLAELESRRVIEFGEVLS